MLIMQSELFLRILNIFWPLHLKSTPLKRCCVDVCAVDTSPNLQENTDFAPTLVINDVYSVALCFRICHT